MNNPFKKPSNVHKRGFASMDKDRLKSVAAKGGKKTAATLDMAKIGQIGGKKTAQRGPEYFARIGRLGGKAKGSKK